MAPSKPTKLQNSNGSVEASRSNSLKQEKSSNGKITKTPIKSQTAKNALSPESIKKLQSLFYEVVGTNSQESGIYSFMRFSSNTLTVNLEQLRANFVSRTC